MIFRSVSFFLLTLTRFSFGLDSNPPEAPQSLADTICTGLPRTQCDVELDVPASCVSPAGDSDCPIVFFLHGSGGTIYWFARTTGVHENNLIGVYPQGEGGWNTGPKNTNQCEWDDFDCETDPDEGAYIASIISKIRTLGASGNVYAIGNSNGAALAYRLASNAGDDLPIKGIVAKVTQLLASPDRSGPGTLNYNQPQGSTPPVAVLSIMGTADNLIPYEGGSSAVFGGDESFQLMSALDSMETWANHNGCTGAYTVEPHQYTGQGTTGEASRYDYSVGCDSGSPSGMLEHYAIHGGGHNAGGVSIDGMPIDYDIAYGFIKRVEDGLLGGGPPVSSPVPPPPSPPTDYYDYSDDDCVDDPNWSGKHSAAHDCEYVSKNPDIRCKWENSDGIKARDACPKACSACSSPVSSPVPPPPSPPTDYYDDSDNDCVDDPNWSGKYSAAHDCEYVSKNPDMRCTWQNSDGIKARDACPEACDIC